MVNFFGKKPLTPHLSSEVNLLVFLTVSKELLCPAETNRENSAIQYVVDFAALQGIAVTLVPKWQCSWCLVRELVLGQVVLLHMLHRGFPRESGVCGVPGLYLTRSTSNNLCSRTCLDKGPLRHLS